MNFTRSYQFFSGSKSSWFRDEGGELRSFVRVSEHSQPGLESCLDCRRQNFREPGQWTEENLRLGIQKRRARDDEIDFVIIYYF